jgi:hypothetical protein
MMRRPAGYHDGIGLIIDGTGEVDLSVLKLEGFFLSSYWYAPDEEYGGTEASILAGIAMHHGFGEERFASKPFQVVYFGHQDGKEYAPEAMREAFAPALRQYGALVSHRLLTVPR